MDEIGQKKKCKPIPGFELKAIVSISIDADGRRSCEIRINSNTLKMRQSTKRFLWSRKSPLGCAKVVSVQQQTGHKMPVSSPVRYRSMIVFFCYGRGRWEI